MAELVAEPKAALKPPQSRRFAEFAAAWQSRQRLDCGGFSAAFAPWPTETHPTGRTLSLGGR